MSQVTLSSVAVSDIMSGSNFLPPQYHEMLPHWADQQAIYDAALSLYSGASLRTKDTARERKDGSAPYLYPLRINVWRWAILVQALFMWGVDNANRVSLFNFDSSPVDLVADASTGNQLSEAMSRIFTNTNVWRKMREATRPYMTFGGHYFGVVPDESAMYGFSWRSLPANFCFPIFDPEGDLKELFISYYIGKEQAKLQGLTVSSDRVVRVEHWDMDGAKIWIDDKLIKSINVSVSDPVTGKAILPWSYAPRMRSTSFYGLSLAEDLVGIGQEYNARLADMGDAIAGSTKLYPWVRNVTREVRNVFERESGDPINLGTEVAGKPEIGVLETVRVVDAAKEHIERIRDEFLEKALIAKVIIGEDEGSQRSGETLTIRALTSIAHAQDCQAAWQGVITNSCNAILSMGKLPFSILSLGRDHRVMPRFEPIMPKDLSAMATIVSTLRGADVMSVQAAITHMGIVSDVDMEVAAIQDEKEQAMQRDMDLAAASRMVDSESSNAKKPAPKSDSKSQAAPKPA